MIPISICGRCGGFSRYCTCTLETAGLFGAIGIHVSVPPHEASSMKAFETNLYLRRVLFSHQMRPRIGCGEMALTTFHLASSGRISVGVIPRPLRCVAKRLFACIRAAVHRANAVALENFPAASLLPARI